MTPLAAGAVLAFKVSFYGLGCDAPGPLTKAGTTPVAGHVIAADPRVLPIGSIVEIDGLGQRQVQDVGGGVRGRHVDVFVSDCSTARRWGVQRRIVRVVHVPVVSAQAPRRAPDHPGAGRLSLVRSETLLTAEREEGTARGLVSQTSLPGRAAPASRSLGGGDWRETDRLAALVVGLLVGAALGLLAVIVALLFDDDARRRLRVWWAWR